MIKCSYLKNLHFQICKYNLKINILQEIYDKLAEICRKSGKNVTKIEQLLRSHDFAQKTLDEDLKIEFDSKEQVGS